MGVENRAISHEEAIENSAGNIRAEEKRRFDLIPNLVDCVKQYDEHEYNTLKDVVAARSAQGQTANVDEVKAMIAAVAEAYPDLKSQKNYQELMNELAITENKISEMRRFYNRNVTDYKRYIRQFPSKQILNLRGYEFKDYERLEFENTSVDAPKNLFD
jgi:LemA protein